MWNGTLITVGRSLKARNYELGAVVEARWARAGCALEGFHCQNSGMGFVEWIDCSPQAPPEHVSYIALIKVAGWQSGWEDLGTPNLDICVE